MNTPNPSLSTEPCAVRRRPILLTAYLTFLIIANAAATGLYILKPAAISNELAKLPEWVFPVFIGVGLLNIICGLALFGWRKLGFWGLAASAIAVLLINLQIGLGLTTALGRSSGLGELCAVGILYGVLRLGKGTDGWSQLT